MKTYHHLWSLFSIRSTRTPTGATLAASQVTTNGHLSLMVLVAVTVIAAAATFAPVLLPATNGYGGAQVAPFYWRLATPASITIRRSSKSRSVSECFRQYYYEDE